MARRPTRAGRTLFRSLANGLCPAAPPKRHLFNACRTAERPHSNPLLRRRAAVRSRARLLLRSEVNFRIQCGAPDNLTVIRVLQCRSQRRGSSSTLSETDFGLPYKWLVLVTTIEHSPANQTAAVK